MGYTHYWRQPKRLDAEKFKAFSSEVAAMAASLAGIVSIKGGNGEGEPEFLHEEVCFNGDGEDSHETFYVSREIDGALDETGRGFTFCETARKPYDLLAVAALCSLSFYFPQVKISSDGEAEDWYEGIQFYQRQTGRQTTYTRVTR